MQIDFSAIDSILPSHRLDLVAGRRAKHHEDPDRPAL
jgi:hypothetical protein